MKTLIVLFLLTFSLTAHADPLATSLPSAPVATVKPPHVFSAVDYSLSAVLIASHVADFTSTRDCISHPTCKEEILPNALVHNRPGFLAYELSTAGLEILGQYLTQSSKWTSPAGIGSRCP